jgi:Histidine kinase-, DNA gyrase B-, and HSP90-like ATPase
LKIDIRPEVASLRMFAAMSYTPWFALGEFVDNAITSSKQNEARLLKLDPEYHLEIDVRFDEGAGTIEIWDNAAGISKADLPRALRTASPPADLRFLSIYGVGMKAAGLWWANTLTIETKALGEKIRRTVTIDTRNLDLPGGGTIQVTERPAPVNQHGTVIRLSNLTKKAPERRTLGKVRAYLSSMYRNFLLDGGNTTIRVKGEELSFSYPEMLEAPIWPSTAGAKRGAPSLTWDSQVEVRLTTGEVVAGWVGLLAKGSTAGAGFLLTFHEKAVVGVGAGTAEGDEFYRPKEIFGGSNSYRRQRLVGEFDVSDFGKSITSDSVNWEAEQEEEFLKLLRKKLSAKTMNFLEQAENYRARGERGAATPTAQAATSEAVAALAKTARSSGTLISDAPEPVSPPENPVVSAHKTRRIKLPLPGGTRSVEVKLTVEQAGEADWLSMYSDADALTVRVNEDHPFMLSFAQLPSQQVEPVLRLALGVGVAEYIDPEHVRTRLNALLRGPLATRSGLESDDD